MDAGPDRIQRDVFIEASPATVWQAITRAEHVQRWFGDRASFRPEAGAEGSVGWLDHGDYPLLVEEVDPERRFVFRWIRRPGAQLAEGSTRVEFVLTPEGHGTRLSVSESGFADLPWTSSERTAHANENDAGWQRELTELADYVAGLVAEQSRA